MKLKTIFSVVLLLCLCNFSFAQNDSIALSIKDYKLPDVTFNSLNFLFNMDGTSAKSEVSTESKSSSFWGGADVNYSRYRNSREIQSSSDVSIGLNGDYLKYTWETDSESSTENERNDDSKYAGFNYQNSTRKYLNSRFFVSYDISVLGAYTQNSEDEQYDDVLTESVTEEEVSLSGGLSLGAGIGRIERVEDARQAFLLLNQLEEESLLSKDYSQKDVFRLATLFSQLKSKRFFDSRKRKMYELEAIDSFLVANQFCEENDARYFVTVMDLWNYGSLQTRESGKRLSLKVTPGYNYNADELETLSEDCLQNKSTSFTTYAHLEYVYHNPINIKWQTDLEVYGDYKLYEDVERNSDNYESVYYHNPNRIGATGAISYYPSTRTTLTFFSNLNYEEQDFDSDSLDGDSFTNETSTFVWTLGAQMYYYISPQLRLQANLDYGYRDYNVTTLYEGGFDDSSYSSNNGNLNYSVGLSYSLF